MTYTSFEFFILYFGITYLLYWVLPKKAKWTVLLAGSVLFYLFASGGHIIFLILSALIVWAVGVGIQKFNDDYSEKESSLGRREKKALKSKYDRYKKAIFAAGILLNLLFIFVLKYYNFFSKTLNVHFSINIPTLSVIVPVGISFYTLQAISYICDVYSGKYKAEKNPLHLMLYLSFMLTSVKGPIARYDQLGTQLVEGRKITSKNFIFGAQLVIWGLFKKIVIADRSAEFVNNAFDQNKFDSGMLLVVAVLLYMLQFYCDFSGIMDVVRGLGQMMGFDMPTNFKQPFFAKSICEFWQRWHITLGEWIKDYVFYPLAKSKPLKAIAKNTKNKLGAYYSALIPISIALLAAWLVNGFWHGPAWNYVAFGLYFFVLMMIGMLLEPLTTKICKGLKINRNGVVCGFFQKIRTFIIVAFSMLIFRANSITQLKSILITIIEKPDLEFLKKGASNGMGLTPEDYIILIGGFILVLLVSILLEKEVDIREKFSKLPFIFEFVVFLGLLFTVIIFGAYGEGYLTIDLPVHVFR